MENAAMIANLCRSKPHKVSSLAQAVQDPERYYTAEIEQEDLQIYFDSIGVQLRNYDEDDSNDVYMKNVAEEINKCFTTGLSYPGYFKQELIQANKKKEKFTRSENDEAIKYHILQWKKFVLIHNYLQDKALESIASQKSFLDEVSKQLQETKDEGHSIYSWNFAITLAFRLIQKSGFDDSEELSENLRHLYSMLMEYQLKQYAQQKLLDRHRDYLLSIINNKEVSQPTRELAVRCLTAFGVIRNSPEDYLTVYNLIRDNVLRINLFKELCLNKKFVALVAKVRETTKEHVSPGTEQEEQKIETPLQPQQEMSHFSRDDADSIELTGGELLDDVTSLV